MPHPKRLALALAIASALALTPITAAPALAVDAGNSTHVATSVANLSKPALKRWAIKKYGTFKKKHITGSGSDVIKLPKGAKAGLVTVTAHGDSNFIAYTLNRDNTERELVANDIGDFKATMAFGLTRKSTAKEMKITADGDWEMTIAPVSTADSISGSHKNRGVYLYGGRAAKLRTKAGGDSNFVIWQYGSPSGSFHLVVNEIAPISTTGVLYRGPSVLEVMADANWRATVR